MYKCSSPAGQYVSYFIAFQIYTIDKIVLNKAFIINF